MNDFEFLKKQEKIKLSYYFKSGEVEYSEIPNEESKDQKQIRMNELQKMFGRLFSLLDQDKKLFFDILQFLNEFFEKFKIVIDSKRRTEMKKVRKSQLKPIKNDLESENEIIENNKPKKSKRSKDNNIQDNFNEISPEINKRGRKKKVNVLLPINTNEANIKEGNVLMKKRNRGQNNKNNIEEEEIENVQADYYLEEVQESDENLNEIPTKEKSKSKFVKKQPIKSATKIRKQINLKQSRKNIKKSGEIEKGKPLLVTISKNLRSNKSTPIVTPRKSLPIKEKVKLISNTKSQQSFAKTYKKARVEINNENSNEKENLKSSSIIIKRGRRELKKEINIETSITAINNKSPRKNKLTTSNELEKSVNKSSRRSSYNKIEVENYSKSKSSSKSKSIEKLISPAKLILPTISKSPVKSKSLENLSSVTKSPSKSKSPSKLTTPMKIETPSKSLRSSSSKKNTPKFIQEEIIMIKGIVNKINSEKSKIKQTPEKKQSLRIKNQNSEFILESASPKTSNKKVCIKSQEVSNSNKSTPKKNSPSQKGSKILTRNSSSEKISHSKQKSKIELQHSFGENIRSASISKSSSVGSIKLLKNKDNLKSPSKFNITPMKTKSESPQQKSKSSDKIQNLSPVRSNKKNSGNKNDIYLNRKRKLTFKSTIREIKKFDPSTPVKTLQSNSKSPKPLSRTVSATKSILHKNDKNQESIIIKKNLKLNLNKMAAFGKQKRHKK